MVDDVTKKTQTDETAVEGENPWKGVQGEIDARFELLPDYVKDVITGAAYQQSLLEIAKSQKLTYEEMGALEVETTMVLLGMIKPEDYRDDVQVQLKKNDAEIDTLVQLVNEHVFTPIRGSLEAIYANKKEPEDHLSDREEATPVPLPPQKTSIPTALPNAQVPVTPAASRPVMPPMPTPSLSTQDKSVLEKTGVVISEAPQAAPSAPMSSRNDLLQGIENPVKTPATNIVADKLKTATPVMQPTKTTDYTIAKTTATPVPTPPPTSRTSDPYREPIS